MSSWKGMLQSLCRPSVFLPMTADHPKCMCIAKSSTYLLHCVNLLSSHTVSDIVDQMHILQMADVPRLILL
jgi:hypothetical protein